MNASSCCQIVPLDWSGISSGTYMQLTMELAGGCLSKGLSIWIISPSTLSTPCCAVYRIRLTV